MDLSPLIVCPPFLSESVQTQFDGGLRERPPIKRSVENEGTKTFIGWVRKRIIVRNVENCMI